jgi:hypothetical protein
MVLASIYEHHAAVTLCLKRVMVGKLVDCHFRFFRWAGERVTRRDLEDVI